MREEAPKIAARDKKRIEDKAELSLEPPKSKLPSVHTAYPKERIEALVQEIKTKDPGQSLTKLRGLRIDQLRKIVENLRADTSARHFAAGFHAADAVRFMGSGASKPPLKARDVSLSVDIGRGPFGDSASRSMSVFSTTSRLDVDRRSRSRSAESVSSIMTEATVSDRRILFEQLPKDIIARANAFPYERPTSLKTREEWMLWIKQAEDASLGTQKVQQQARLDREARDAESSEIIPATVPLPTSPTAKPASPRLAPPPIVEEAVLQPGKHDPRLATPAIDVTSYAMRIPPRVDPRGAQHDHGESYEEWSRGESAMREHYTPDTEHQLPSSPAAEPASAGWAPPPIDAATPARIHAYGPEGDEKSPEVLSDLSDAFEAGKAGLTAAQAQEKYPNIKFGAFTEFGRRYREGRKQYDAARHGGATSRALIVSPQHSLSYQDPVVPAMREFSLPSPIDLSNLRPAIDISRYPNIPPLGRTL